MLFIDINEDPGTKVYGPNCTKVLKCNMLVSFTKLTISATYYSILWSVKLGSVLIFSFIALTP